MKMDVDQFERKLKFTPGMGGNTETVEVPCQFILFLLESLKRSEGSAESIATFNNWLNTMTFKVRA